MSLEPVPTVVAHEMSIDAPVQRVFDLVAKVTDGPQFFPTHVHAEVVGAGADGDVVERWVVDGGEVRGWRVRREIDESAHRVLFEHVAPKPPVARMRGEWTFRPGSATRVRVEHRVEFLAGADPAAVEPVSAGLDRAVPAQLAQLREVAEEYDRLRRRTVRVERSVLLDGSAADVYGRVLAGATADGATWARVCVPPGGAVVKWLGRDARIRTLTGQVRVAPTAGGVEVTATATATLREAPGVTQAGARRWLDRGLGAGLAQLGRIQ